MQRNRWTMATLLAFWAVALAVDTASAGCVLEDGLVTLKLDAAGGTVVALKGDKQVSLRGAAGAEVALDLAPLGLPAGANDRYVGWDGTAQAFLPPFASPLKLVLASAPEQKVNIRPLEPRPQLVGAAGGVLKVNWDAEKSVLSGVCRVPANTPYPLAITAPPVPEAWRLVAADVAKEDWTAGVVPEPWQSGPWAGVILRSPVEREVAWTVSFKKAPAAGEAAKVGQLRVIAVSPKKVELRWVGEGGYYLLRRNDRPAIGLFAESYLDKDIAPKTTYTYTVSAMSWSGAAKAEASVAVEVPEGPPPLPKPDVYLSDLPPVKATVGWNERARKDKSIEDNPLRIAGETYERGMGVHAHSELIYEVKPEYARFVAYAGADDEKGPGQGTVVFKVYADGKQLHESGVKRGGQEPDEINVEIPPGTRQLVLIVTDAGDGVGCDHADWARAGFVLKK